jgi:hypothetical protein
MSLPRCTKSWPWRPSTTSATSTRPPGRPRSASSRHRGHHRARDARAAPDQQDRQRDVRDTAPAHPARARHNGSVNGCAITSQPSPSQSSPAPRTGTCAPMNPPPTRYGTSGLFSRRHELVLHGRTAQAHRQEGEHDVHRSGASERTRRFPIGRLDRNLLGVRRDQISGGDLCDDRHDRRPWAKVTHSHAHHRMTMRSASALLFEM